MDECRDEGMNSWRVEKTSIHSPAESYIEWRFECRCDELAYGSEIQTEWRERKRQYKAWTDTIVFDFQHFSRHDASHSVNILEAIEMLLGKERIDKLSAGDLWLLLECAYQHDIGMAITYDDLVMLWRDPDFKNYIEEQIYSELADDREAALFYSDMNDLVSHKVKISEIETEKPQGGKGVAEEAKEPWEVHIQRCLMYLVSSYIRQGHADRILELEKRVPVSENSAIPGRLYNVARIASKLHGEPDYEEIINQLKECTKGFGNGKVHPRFISAMLRVGDALDIENNRFNIRAIRHFGDLPYQSKLHLKKHKAVTHIKITPMQVEVEARSADLDVCKVLSDDFQSIESEVKNLIGYWNVLAPKELGGCTLRQSKSRIFLGDSDRCYDSSVERRVEMDRERVMPLFMGGNIYPNYFEFIREYLQNALDATKMQLWLDVNKNKTHRKLNPEIYEKSELSPFDISRELYEEYPIEVEYELDIEKKKVQLRIRDYGIGIERECKGMITNIGRGWKERSVYSKELKNMPDWLRPTGGFGIGMQSAFMLADKVEIYTHSIKDAEGYKITIDSPENGSHVTTEDYDMEERGTVVCVGIPLDKFMIWNSNRKNADRKDAIGEIEFSGPGDFFDINNIISYIGEFLEKFIHIKVNHRLFPIYISAKGRTDKVLPINFHPGVNYWMMESDHFRKWRTGYDVLKDEDGISLIDKFEGNYYGWINKEKILYRVDLADNLSGLENMTYKNVLVSENGSAIPYKKYLKLYMDLLGGEVKKLLKISRNEFRDNVITEKWDQATMKHFLKAMAAWSEKKQDPLDSTAGFFDELYQRKPYLYLYRAIYGDGRWESIDKISKNLNNDQLLITGESYLLDEHGWTKRNKAIIDFRMLYTQIKRLLKGMPDAKMVFCVDIIKNDGQRDHISSIRLMENKEKIQSTNIRTNELNTENVNQYFAAGNVLIEDEDLYQLLIGTKQVQVDYFVTGGFGENVTLYAWLTPKKNPIISFDETAFYKNSWQNVSASGSSSRYYCEVTDPKFYPELQVKALPFNLSEQDSEEKRCWIISPISRTLVMKYGEMNWKILWQEFYDDVTSDITYEFLIQWVSDHQVKERRCKKEEIRKAYIEYLKMIYKYNLSDAS